MEWKRKSVLPVEWLSKLVLGLMLYTGFENLYERTFHKITESLKLGQILVGDKANCLLKVR